MKLISYIFVVLCSIVFMASPKMNPLSDTSWNGILNAPTPTDANLKFSKDTMYVYIDTQLIETSVYTISNDTLSVTKFSGNSPCIVEVGLYTFEIDTDMLFINPVSDLCDARFYAFDPLGYKKEE